MQVKLCDPCLSAFETVCVKMRYTNRRILYVYSLIVTSKWAPMNPPAFYLNFTRLPITDSYKYLGHIINCGLTDDLDIQNQTRSLYARANMLKRRFSAASLHTKCMLFNAYCTPMDVSCGTLHTAITMIDCVLLLMIPLDFC